MKRLFKYVSIAICLSILTICGQANTALAIGNPTSVEFGSGTNKYYKVFENVLETSDMLFVAEGYVNYTVEPTDYTAEEAFIFEVLNTAGNETIISRSLVDYGDRPISIYLTAAQKTSLGVVSGTAYKLRIRGNPSIFASQTGNSVNATLAGEDYINQSLSGNTTTTNLLRNFMILMAIAIEAEDVPTDSYLTISQGITYLSSEGANIFLAGVPFLDSMCPVLFVNAVESLSDDQPTSTGAYAITLSPLARWGNTTANGLTNVGVYLGINQALAGATVALILGALLAVFVYKKLQSGVATLMIMATYPFIISWLGLMPLALAFIIMILIVILGGYYFFKQGAL